MTWLLKENRLRMLKEAELVPAHRWVWSHSGLSDKTINQELVISLTVYVEVLSEA